jgi:3-isopropylmalate dehydrogenase
VCACACNGARWFAAILSAAMMLRYTFKDREGAARIERAVRAVLAQGYRTADMAQAGAKRVGCREMGEAVVASLNQVAALK